MFLKGCRRSGWWPRWVLAALSPRLKKHRCPVRCHQNFGALILRVEHRRLGVPGLEVRTSVERVQLPWWFHAPPGGSVVRESVVAKRWSAALGPLPFRRALHLADVSFQPLLLSRWPRVGGLVWEEVVLGLNAFVAGVETRTLVFGAKSPTSLWASSCWRQLAGWRKQEPERVRVVAFLVAVVLGLP